jgi:hypothetical protein
VSESDPERCAAAEDRPADRWLRTYLEDSMLWPTLIAGTGILVTSGAGILLLAVRGRNPFVWAALLLLAGGTFDAVSRDLRRRRFGLLSRAVVGVWVASAGAAVLALRLGLA